MTPTYEYPRPAVTVDILLTRVTETYTEVLLIQRKDPPFAGHWALPGGFVDEYEPLEAAAARELREETGLEGLVLTQFGAYGDPGRDPRGWTVSIVFLGEVAGEIVLRAGDDAAAARWWSLDALPPLAFDHAQIIEDWGANVAAVAPSRRAKSPSPPLR